MLRIDSAVARSLPRTFLSDNWWRVLEAAVANPVAIGLFGFQIRRWPSREDDDGFEFGQPLSRNDILPLISEFLRTDQRRIECPPHFIPKSPTRFWSNWKK